MNLELTVENKQITLEVAQTNSVTLTVGSPSISFDVLTSLPPSADTPGVNTGDFLRWNEDTEAWEVAEEPIEFTQIVLKPAELPVEDIEGGLWYKSTEKAVFVCTDI